jgi:S1-C subfamily serine protease
MACRLLWAGSSGRDVGYIRGLTFAREIGTVPMVKGKKVAVGDSLALMSYPGIFTRDLQTSFGFVTDENAQASLGSMGIEWNNAIVSDMSAGSGSSGGPVFNTDGEFIGIHVGGFSGNDSGGLELNFQLIFEEND